MPTLPLPMLPFRRARRGGGTCSRVLIGPRRSNGVLFNPFRFSGLTALHFLNLAQSRITEIVVGTFSSLTAMGYLSFGSNYITRLATNEVRPAGARTGPPAAATATN